MSELKNEIESPEGQQRREAGKDGKLWSIVVMAKHGLWGQETKRFARCNLYSNEIMDMRKSFFTHGILMPVDPGHWIVILPWDILQIDIIRQKHFQENEHFR